MQSGRMLAHSLTPGEVPHEATVAKGNSLQPSWQTRKHRPVYISKRKPIQMSRERLQVLGRELNMVQVKHGASQQPLSFSGHNDGHLPFSV